MVDEPEGGAAPTPSPAPNGAPFRAKRARRVPGLVRFLLGVLAALLLGTVIEKATELISRDTSRVQASFARFEKTAVDSVESLQPGAAWQLFSASMTSAPSPYSMFVRVNGDLRRVMHPAPPRERSDIERETGVRLGYWGDERNRVPGMSPFAPVLALADVVWHLLTTGQWVARIMVLAQIFLGATITAAILIWMSRRGWGLPGILPVPVFALGAVAMASGSAYATSFVMTSAQHLFGGVSHIAGFTVSLSALTGGCVAFFQKSVELTLHKRLETVIEKI